MQARVEVAKTYHDELGSSVVIEFFEQNFSEDAFVHFEYIHTAFRSIVNHREEGIARVTL